MPTQENHINPCFCISLRAGSILVSIFDIIYGTGYIFRFMYIEYLQENFHDYFPEPIPNPTKSEFMFQMSRRGNYIATILLGIMMLLATNYLRYYFVWLVIVCYTWLFTKLLLIISLSIFCNALIESKQSHFHRFGYEILFYILINLYFMLVVAMFVRESRIALNNYRATKPINIERSEHEDYLRNDRESKFNNATSYHYMSPDFYLNADKDVQSSFRYNLPDTHVDETLLQYVISGSKVEVVEEESEVERERKPSVMTLKAKNRASKASLSVRGSSSFLPSEMSMMPDLDRGDDDDDVEWSDMSMFSRSQTNMRFSTILKNGESWAGPPVKINQKVVGISKPAVVSSTGKGLKGEEKKKAGESKPEMKRLKSQAELEVENLGVSSVTSSVSSAKVNKK